MNSSIFSSTVLFPACFKTSKPLNKAVITCKEVSLCSDGCSQVALCPPVGVSFLDCIMFVVQPAARAFSSGELLPHTCGTLCCCLCSVLAAVRRGEGSLWSGQSSGLNEDFSLHKAVSHEN